MRPPRKTLLLPTPPPRVPADRRHGLARTALMTLLYVAGDMVVTPVLLFTLVMSG